ncbi:hypothetical protein Ocin01_06633 [Orchesella cincta]|uniref:Uncharacterized protein n=1 Tax=Orchesella cincta TaxID=48709 RepID=A0A1D2N459_ORCCI|nr:hypothetical protein Ocin01_06633 [Orchesella cincta]
MCFSLLSTFPGIERTARRLFLRLALAYRASYFRKNTLFGWLEIFARFVLIPGAAFGLLVFLSFFLVDTFLRPPAVMVISILDAKEDLNFPDKNPYPESDNGSVVWKVDRFSYFDKFPEKSEEVLGRFEKLPSGQQLNKKGRGFWVYKNVPRTKTASTNGIENGDEEEYVYTDLSASTASIRAMKIMEHLKSAGRDPEELEVAVGIRAYLDGEAMIVVRFQDGITHQIEGRRLSKRVFGNKGFCYKILDDIPFDKRIDMVQILPITTSFKRHAIAIVDQVVIVVAQRGVTESIIHTLIPSGWC